MNKRVLNLLLVCLSSITLSSCKNNKKKVNPIDKDEITYDGINLHYNCDDDDMNRFMNDFTHRNMRYDSDSCGEYPVAHGTGFAKNWEAMAVCFQNSTKQVYREDKQALIADYLIKIDQDDQGMIYNTPLVNEDPYSEAGYDLTGFSVPQGWPFPSWLNSVNNYFDLGNLEAVHTTEFNFNDAGHPQSLSWHVDNGEFAVGVEQKVEGQPDFHFDDGYAHFNTPGNGNSYLSNSQSFYFYRDNLDTLLPFSSGIDSRFSPMIDIEIEYDARNIKDYNIIFKVAGDNNWHIAPQSIYASTPLTQVDGYVHIRQFFDMYLHTEWNHQTITDLGIQFVPKDGKDYYVRNGKINFIRPTYDTRQANATYQFIQAVATYFSFTRDMKTLIKLMPKVRKGILFMNHSLEGEKGLLSLEYLYGHDGIVPYCINGRGDRLAYHAIGNGYSDLTVAPMINLEANIYYYQALKAAAMLEEAMQDVKDDDPTSLSVKNRMVNAERIPYTCTKDSLEALAAIVKANMEKPVQVQKVENFDYTYNAGDYHYRNVGGLYNPETGRFCIGINEYNGRVLDYGHLYLNLECVCAGIGTDAQQLSIMEWVDGRRIIVGDTSTGDDIYFYDFAPRFNTRNVEEDGGCMGFMQDENFQDRLWYFGYDTWSRQVQNGGAVIAWSYYDIVARTKVFGIDNAMKRLEEIKKWYLKVLDFGGNGVRFYDDYYEDLDYHATIDDPDMYWIYSVQASGITGPGAVGLDAEFIESVILIRALPDALFGLNAKQNNNLVFTYQEDKTHDFFEIYNMKYGDAVYSIRSKKNVIQVFNVSGEVSDKHTITFRYKTNNPNISIKVNGEVFNNVQMVDGYACVTVPFGNTKVLFG